MCVGNAIANSRKIHAHYLYLMAAMQLPRVSMISLLVMWAVNPGLVRTAWSPTSRLDTPPNAALKTDNFSRLLWPGLCSWQPGVSVCTAWGHLLAAPAWAQADGSDQAARGMLVHFIDQKGRLEKSPCYPEVNTAIMFSNASTLLQLQLWKCSMWWPWPWLGRSLPASAFNTHFLDCQVKLKVAEKEQ